MYQTTMKYLPTHLFTSLTEKFSLGILHTTIININLHILTISAVYTKQLNITWHMNMYTI